MENDTVSTGSTGFSSSTSALESFLTYLHELRSDNLHDDDIDCLASLSAGAAETNEEHAVVTKLQAVTKLQETNAAPNVARHGGRQIAVTLDEPLGAMVDQRQLFGRLFLNNHQPCVSIALGEAVEVLAACSGSSNAGPPVYERAVVRCIGAYFRRESSVRQPDKMLDLQYLYEVPPPNGVPGELLLSDVWRTVRASQVVRPLLVHWGPSHLSSPAAAAAQFFCCRTYHSSSQEICDEPDSFERHGQPPADFEGVFRTTKRHKLYPVVAANRKRRATEPTTATTATRSVSPKIPRTKRAARFAEAKHAAPAFHASATERESIDPASSENSDDDDYGDNDELRILEFATPEAAAFGSIGAAVASVGGSKTQFVGAPPSAPASEEMLRTAFADVEAALRMLGTGIGQLKALFLMGDAPTLDTPKKSAS
ncbi:Hypothetical protein UVM_LOCUS407 [uncultured virus]|nr:Hypothetical protein UVM_LOCUS407 [uncultured virus]